MLTMNYARQLLEMSAACLEAQSQAARKYARTADYTANTSIANELQHKAQVIREALAPSSSSVACPHCGWGFFPSVIDQHIREKHT